SVHHWNDKLFSFRTSRDRGFRFRNGHFVMLGIEVDGRPLTRAYSIASPNHEEFLEFFSIKVDHGALTSRLQNVSEGDTVLLSQKPVGTLVLDDLNDGERLFLLATGTGLAPFLSIIQDPEAYERFGQIVLVHGVRRVCDLAYRDFIEDALPRHEFLGEFARDQLCYYPTVTRESFPQQGRIPDLMASGKLCDDLGIAPFDASTDRAMICGSMSMLRDTQHALEGLGLAVSPRQGVRGDFVIERAFVEAD
ncbi:MAG: ferredoxin--NADP reductase, partial [Pseudomonadota bacterium]